MTADHIDRAAEVLGDALGSSYSHAVCRLLARRLDAAGLLASPDLLAEVDRLRRIEAGVEAIADEWERDDPWSDLDRSEEGRTVRALLNPTEGRD